MRLLLATEAFALNGISYSGFPLILDDRMRLIEEPHGFLSYATPVGQFTPYGCS